LNIKHLSNNIRFSETLIFYNMAFLKFDLIKKITESSQNFKVVRIKNRLLYQCIVYKFFFFISDPINFYL